MSEMLGNQYFMARNYAEAEHELEPLLNNVDDARSLSRKLIICYTQTGKLEKALSLFNELITEDIEFVLEADPVKDDCPCTELVDNIEKIERENSIDYLVLTGILWLYCDYKKSLHYFAKAVEQSPENKDVAFAYNTIRHYFETHSELK
jgi:pentatricopeptide repeat protein